MPVEPPDAPPSTPPVDPLFTVLPTKLNWFRMAPATPGPANTITRPMIAMIRTYSMIDCPRRRVFLGDTPPRRLIAAACMCDTPFVWGLILHAGGYGRTGDPPRNVPQRYRSYCHAFGGTTPRAFPAKSVWVTFEDTFQFEQSSDRELHPENIQSSESVFEKSPLQKPTD